LQRRDVKEHDRLIATAAEKIPTATRCCEPVFDGKCRAADLGKTRSYASAVLLLKRLLS
jgi:hypothetical protein